MKCKLIDSVQIVLDTKFGAVYGSTWVKPSACIQIEKNTECQILKEGELFNSISVDISTNFNVKKSKNDSRFTFIVEVPSKLCQKL